MATSRAPRRDPAATRGLSRKAQGELTRRAILDAAIDLYGETGFRGTGLMAIGERAGVHHATVLYHYGSSKALLLAVLDERERLLAEFSIQAFNRPGVEVLRNLPVLAEFAVAHRRLTKLLVVLQVENLAPEAEAHDYFVERRRATHELLATNVRMAQEAGDVRADADADAVADLILAFTTGAQIQHFLMEPELDLVAAYRDFTAVLLRDLVSAG